MINSNGREIKPKTTSNHHKFKIVIHTINDGNIEDKIYKSKKLANKRLSTIVNLIDEGKFHINSDNFSYISIEEIFC